MCKCAMQGFSHGKFSMNSNRRRQIRRSWLSPWVKPVKNYILVRLSCVRNDWGKRERLFTIHILYVTWARSSCDFQQNRKYIYGKWSSQFLKINFSQAKMTAQLLFLMKLPMMRISVILMIQITQSTMKVTIARTKTTCLVEWRLLTQVAKGFHMTAMTLSREETHTAEDVFLLTFWYDRPSIHHWYTFLRPPRTPCQTTRST